MSLHFVKRTLSLRGETPLLDKKEQPVLCQLLQPLQFDIRVYVRTCLVWRASAHRLQSHLFELL